MNVKLSPWVTAIIIAVMVLVIYVVYTVVDSPARRGEEMEKFIRATAAGVGPAAKGSPAPVAPPKTPKAKGSPASK